MQRRSSRNGLLLQVRNFILLISFPFVLDLYKGFLVPIERSLANLREVLLCGTIPMVVVAYLSSPFVNYIHLVLPTFARTSRDLMLRYSKNPPKDAMLDITTMNFIGKPRVSRVYISDLRPMKQRLGIVNYVRDTKVINKSRSWWMGRAVRVFGVHSGAGKVRGGEAWENIARRINSKS
jgi:hypothetical protein